MNKPAHSPIFQLILDHIYEAGIVNNGTNTVRFVYVCMTICLDLADNLQDSEVVDQKTLIAASKQVHKHVAAFVAMVNRVADREQEEGRRLEFIQRVVGGVVKLVVAHFHESRVRAMGQLQRGVFYYCLRELTGSQLRPGTTCVVQFLEFLW